MFLSGNDLPIFKTPTATIGIQICWVTHFPEISRVMALKGVDIIFTPFASPVKGSKRKDIWLKYLAARAYDNNVFIAEDFKAEESILFIELDPSLLN